MWEPRSGGGGLFLEDRSRAAPVRASRQAHDLTFRQIEDDLQGVEPCHPADVQDLVDRVRSRHPDVPVLFMSGYAEPAFAAGHDGTLEHSFISKPFDRQKLLYAVRKAIESVSLAPAYVHREPAAG